MLDEANEVAKAIANSNHNSVIFSLLPMQHSSTDGKKVLANQRIVEDRLSQNPGYALLLHVSGSQTWTY